MNLKSKFRGALLGLAAGDAVGTTLEFKPPGSFTKINDMMGGGPFRLAVGEWTVVFDIGNTVRAALTKFAETHESFCGSSDSWSAGNGSLMRLAPVPLFFVTKPQDAIERSGESQRTTHGAAAAVDASRYFGGLIAGAIQGAAKEELFSDRYAPVLGYWDRYSLVPEIDEIALGSSKRLRPPHIKGSGYVVKCLEAALWAFHSSDTFREGCLLAVNLRDDADRTGAVYGQIAGAYYGEDGIPEDRRRKLPTWN